MPIYEYRCLACAARFEELVLGKAEVRCPECNSGDCERLISGFSWSRGGTTGAAATSSASGSCGSCRPSPGSCAACRR